VLVRLSFAVISALAGAWTILAVDHGLTTLSPKLDGFSDDTRGIEQTVSPEIPFTDAAIISADSYYGFNSASYVDSFDSRNGKYDPAVKDNPAHPWFGDSRHGTIHVGGATAFIRGSVYGDVTTNGGNVKNGNPGIIYGTIDNNVSFTLDPYVMPSTKTWNYIPIPTAVLVPTSLTPPNGGTADQPNFYLFSSINDVLTVNSAVVSGDPVDTYIAIRVTGDTAGSNAGITVNPKVHLTIYFDGSIDVKTARLINQSPSSTNPFAGNLKFYGIPPTSGTQQIHLDSPAGRPFLAATFYAPGADVLFGGAADIYGQVIGKSFYANGSIIWHYDRALNDGVMPTPTPSRCPTCQR